MSDETKQPEKESDQPAPIPAPIVGVGASDLRQMKEEAI